MTSALARPRRTQDEIDEHYEQHPDGSLRFADFSEAQLTELEELEQGLEASSKFLLGSAGWVDQLERVRGEFRHCCLLLFRQQGRQNELRNFNVKAEHNDDLFFPHGHEALLTHVKFYLIWAVKNIKGVRRGSTAPRMLTIIRRRYAIYCWVRMKLSHPPVYTVWQVRTNQAMAFATKKYGINTEGSAPQIPFVTAADVAYRADEVILRPA